MKPPPTYRDALFALSDKLRDCGIRLVLDTELTITEYGSADPKMIGAALLGRSLGNFKGAVQMVRAGLVVEARTLVRSCYENLFFIEKLEAARFEFVKRMREDEVASKLKRTKFVLDTPELLEGLLEETRLRLQAHVDTTKEQFPKAKILNPKGIAEGGRVEHAYLAYSQLSADAAHPSFASLARHFFKIKENGEDVRCFDVQPVAKDAELDETLYLGCSAFLGCVVGVNQLFGGTHAGKELWELSDQFTAISKQRWTTYETRSSEESA